jgi:molybdopterin-guanine dinucleotide biosynthesis protein A
MSAHRVGVLVVAGGHSRRMGRDKNFISLEGEPLLTRVCRRASELGPVWVVARAQQELPDLAGATRVPDEEREDGLAGPLLGIASGLAVMHEAGVELAAIVGSDDAGLESAMLRARLAQLEQLPKIEGVCLESEGFVQPLASAVRVAPALQRARDLLAAGQARASLWAGEFRRLQGAAVGAVWDLDTPAQLREWREQQTKGD